MVAILKSNFNVEPLTTIQLNFYLYLQKLLANKGTRLFIRCQCMKQPMSQIPENLRLPNSRILKSRSG